MTVYIFQIQYNSIFLGQIKFDGIFAIVIFNKNFVTSSKELDLDQIFFFTLVRIILSILWSSVSNLFLLSYYMGIHNKSTGKIRVVPASLVQMEPWFQGRDGQRCHRVV